MGTKGRIKTNSETWYATPVDITVDRITLFTVVWLVELALQDPLIPEDTAKKLNDMAARFLAILLDEGLKGPPKIVNGWKSLFGKKNLTQRVTPP